MATVGKSAATPKREMRPASAWLAVALFVAIIASVAALPSAASAEITFPGGTVISNGSGSGPGQLVEPFDVSVDPSNGRLYVADRASQRVDVFGPTGFIMAFGWGVADGSSPEPQTCTTSCFEGLAGSGPGQLNNARAIAVDGDPTSPSYHDVYVFERGNHRVEKFDASGAFLLAFGEGVNHTNGEDVCTAASGDICGAGIEGTADGQFGGEAKMTVGPGGKVYVSDLERVQRFSPEGAFEASIPLTANAGFTDGLAVDSAGDIYVSSEPPAVTNKYDPTGALLETLPVAGSALAMDPNGNLFVSAAEGERKLISEFSSSGDRIADFGYYREGEAEATAMVGLASFESGNGDLYVATPAVAGVDTPRIWRVQKPAPGPLALEATTTASTIKNTSAVLQSSFNPEGEATSYKFQYVDQADYEKGGAGFTSPATKTTATAHAPAEFKVFDADVEATDLTPETTYKFRLIASNTIGEAISETGTFKTLTPLSIEGAWSTSVTTNSATLNANINPLGIPASAYFEYVDSDNFAATGFAGAIQVPAVNAGAAPIDVGESEEASVISAPITSLSSGQTYYFRVVVQDRFATIPGNPVALTTIPPAGVPEVCANQAFRVGPGANLPDCRAYEMVSPVDKEGSDLVPAPTLIAQPASLDQSAEDGSGLTYSSFRAFGEPEGAPYANQYIARRTESGWLSQNISPPRGPRILTVGNSIDREFRAFSPDLSIGWLFHDSGNQLSGSGAKGYVNLYSRSSATGTYQALTTVAPPGVQPAAYMPDFEGASEDGSRAIFVAPAKLTPDANAISGRDQLYEAHNGKLALVSILPNGRPNPTFASAGGNQGGTGIGGRVSTVKNAMSATGEVIYWTATPSPSATAGPGTIYARLHGTETISVSALASPAPATFQLASRSGEVAVFSVDTGGESGSDLYKFDLSTRSVELIAHHVVGVAGGGEDLAYFYFVSTDALVGGAQEGAENLYVDHGGSIGFVAKLTFDDTHNHTGNDVSAVPSFNVSRVSADGTHLLFMSSASLTGRDNHDAVSGEPDQQVFVFNASDGVLSCASCNRTGARPEGRAIPKETTASGAPLWIAARTPVWQSQLYAGREISSNGRRVFFESFDSLVPADANGKGDVYEWEEDGSGGCRESAGCLGLISSGEGRTDSEFVDASASGDDVFFRTSDSLVPQDPGLVDIYDARVGGGFPSPAPPRLPCSGEACQSPTAATGNLTPGTNSFVGPGNKKGAKPRACPAGKRSVRRHGKVRCVAKGQKGHPQKQKHGHKRRQKKPHRSGAHRRGGQGQ